MARARERSVDGAVEAAVRRRPVQRAPLGPNFLVHLESLLKIGREAGLPDRIVTFAGDLLGLFIGAYVFEETMADHAAMTPEVVDAMGQWFASLPPAHFPNILALAGIMTAGDSNERFEWGADVLIRGPWTYAEGGDVAG